MRTADHLPVFRRFGRAHRQQVGTDGGANVIQLPDLEVVKVYAVDTS